jgi:hypothetical protein
MGSRYTAFALLDMRMRERRSPTLFLLKTLLKQALYGWGVCLRYRLLGFWLGLSQPDTMQISLGLNRAIRIKVFEG